MHLPMSLFAVLIIISQASFALSDGDYGKAYKLLYRYSSLVIKCLPTHPQYKEPEGRKACSPLLKRLPEVMGDLEALKPEIERAHEEWERMQPAEDAPEAPSAPSYADFASRDPTLSGNAKILDAAENQELAVDLAQKELMRRDTLRRATRQAGIPEEQTAIRRWAGRWDQYEANRAQGYDLQSQMESVRRNLDAPSAGREDTISHPISNNYSYPTISRSRPVQYDRTESQTSVSSGPRPAPPPKEPLREFEATPPPPQVPGKVSLSDYKPLIPSQSTEPAELPSLPPKTALDAPQPPQKERLTFKPGAYLENGDPIRSIFLPGGLRRKFLEIASSNTRRGLEMCGILCGIPINNALFVRCLLIPDQKCTSDTCETENEGAMFDFCDKEDLLMLGWIHTHPTQTCFMSSRDLHTHSGYQIMMPEAIAIVCAPKFTPS